MTTKKRWSPEDDAELISTIEYVVGEGGMLKTACELFASDTGRTLAAVKRRYFDIKPDGAEDLRLRTKGESEPFSPPFKPIAPKEDGKLHPSLVGVSDCIKGLESQNEAQRRTIDGLLEQNEMLSERIAKLETCEAELNHLLTIINRSRKEAFAVDAAPKKYKVIDGVPVFQD